MIAVGETSLEALERADAAAGLLGGEGRARGGVRGGGGVAAQAGDVVRVESGDVPAAGEGLSEVQNASAAKVTVTDNPTVSPTTFGWMSDWITKLTRQ